MRLSRHVCKLATIVAATNLIMSHSNCEQYRASRWMNETGNDLATPTIDSARTANLLAGVSGCSDEKGPEASGRLKSDTSPSTSSGDIGDPVRTGARIGHIAMQHVIKGVDGPVQNISVGITGV
jgi:hypothetical protein